MRKTEKKRERTEGEIEIELVSESLSRFTK